MHSRWKRESCLVLLTLLSLQWSASKNRRQIATLLHGWRLPRQRHDSSSMAQLCSAVRLELEARLWPTHDALHTALDQLCSGVPRQEDILEIQLIQSSEPLARKHIEKFICGLLQRRFADFEIPEDVSAEVLRKLCIGLRCQPFKRALSQLWAKLDNPRREIFCWTDHVEGKEDVEDCEGDQQHVGMKRPKHTIRSSTNSLPDNEKDVTSKMRFCPRALDESNEDIKGMAEQGLTHALEEAIIMCSRRRSYSSSSTISSTSNWLKP